MKIALRLNTHADGNKLQVLLQLNLDQEDSKAGIDAKQALAMVPQICELQRLELRGFMLIPKARENLNEQRKPFALARELLEKCNQTHGLAMDTLSMGMSQDLEAAIAEGSTMVRIGTDLFGARPN
jgi:pyridoxal phosphate enzyme (YggS family)